MICIRLKFKLNQKGDEKMSEFTLTAFADEIDEDLVLQMDVLEQHGIKYIEMRNVNGKNLVEYSLEEVREIKQQIDVRGFQLSAIGSPIGKIKITDPFAPHLDLFQHTVEIAKIMECPYIRMFSFFIPENESPTMYRDEVLNRWQQFTRIAEEHQLTLLHENEKGVYGDIPERCLDLVESLNSEHVKLIFDFANFVQCGVRNYPDGYELLKDYLAYIHVKDALVSNKRVVPAGFGDGNVEEILKELEKNDFVGFLSIEPHLSELTGFDDLDEDSPGYDLPKGRQRSFAVAVQALKKLLD